MVRAVLGAMAASCTETSTVLKRNAEQQVRLVKLRGWLTRLEMLQLILTIPSAPPR